MKITSALAAAAAIAAAGSVGIIGAPNAAADDTSTTTIGSQAKLVDGNVVQGWTITGLKTSSDPIPYPVAGTLWEATATDEAIQGGATPIVSNLNARARSGQTYRALFGVATPQGVNPSTLAPGEKTTGKVYFDVTGETPDSVVYNAGGQDLLVWVQPAAGPPGRSPVFFGPGARSDVAGSGGHPGNPRPGGQPRGDGHRRHAASRKHCTANRQLRNSASRRQVPKALPWPPACKRPPPLPQAAKAPRFPRAARARRPLRPQPLHRGPLPESSGVG